MATATTDPQQADAAPTPPEAPADAGTALEHAPRGVPSVTTAARFGFDPDQMVAVRRTLAPKASPEELVMFLELCARYELDPFAKHVWCAPMSGDSGPHSIFLSRDGYLAIANRHPEFGGMDSAPVYENDEFRLVRDGDGLTIHHESGKPVERGALVGAYALVHRRGRAPSYFFADAAEYVPDSPNKRTPWFKQPSAMLKKCAESNALRIAYSVSGFIPAEESAAIYGREPVNPSVAEEPQSPYGDDEIGERLRAAVERVNDLRPGRYRPAKLRLDLTGATDNEREAYAAHIEAEAQALEDAQPRPEVVEDAVVIVDDEPVGPDPDPDAVDPADQPSLEEID